MGWRYFERNIDSLRVFFRRVIDDTDACCIRQLHRRLYHEAWYTERDRALRGEHPHICCPHHATFVYEADDLQRLIQSFRSDGGAYVAASDPRHFYVGSAEDVLHRARLHERDILRGRGNRGLAAHARIPWGICRDYGRCTRYAVEPPPPVRPSAFVRHRSPFADFDTEISGLRFRIIIPLDWVSERSWMWLGCFMSRVTNHFGAPGGTLLRAVYSLARQPDAYVPRPSEVLLVLEHCLLVAVAKTRPYQVLNRRYDVHRNDLHVSRLEFVRQHLEGRWSDDTYKRQHDHLLRLEWEQAERMRRRRRGRRSVTY